MCATSVHVVVVGTAVVVVVGTAVVVVELVGADTVAVVGAVVPPIVALVVVVTLVAVRRGEVELPIVPVITGGLVGGVTAGRLIVVAGRMVATDSCVDEVAQPAADNAATVNANDRSRLTSGRARSTLPRHDVMSQPLPWRNNPRDDR